MGSVNSVPVVAQVKSAVQAIGGDREGARETQEDFSRKCLVISQVRSIVEVIKGDKAAAKETQLQCLRNFENIVDAVPLVGHVKGAVHYGLGDKIKGDQSMKSASRTIVVGGVGIAGGVIGGPGGAVAGGAAGGAIMDGIITVVNSAVHKSFRPEGTIAGIKMLADMNINKRKKIGIGFDTVIGVAFDGLVGIGAYRLIRFTVVYCKPCVLEEAGVKSFMDASGKQLLKNFIVRSLPTVISHIKKILEETMLKGMDSRKDSVKEFLNRLINDPDFRVKLKDHCHIFPSPASEICKEDNSLTHVKAVKGETCIHSNELDNLQNGEMLFEGFINTKTEPQDLYEISACFVEENQGTENLSIYMDAEEYFEDKMLSEDIVLNMDSKLPEVNEKDINVILIPDDKKTEFVVEKEERNGKWIIKAEFVDDVGNKKGIKIVLSIADREEVGVMERSAEHEHQTCI